MTKPKSSQREITVLINCDFCIQNGRDNSRKDRRIISAKFTGPEDQVMTAAYIKLRSQGWRCYEAEKKVRCALCILDKAKRELTESLSRERADS